MSKNDNYRSVITAIYNKLGYTVDEELFRILTSDAQHILVQAPAGGTKTTIGQVYINVERVKQVIKATLENAKGGALMSTSFNPENIRAFVYNTHNVKDIMMVNNKIYGATSSLGLLNSDNYSSRYSNPLLTASTIHSFAYEMLLENMKLLNLRNLKKASEWVLDLQLSTIIKNILSESGNLRDYKACYNLYTSLMIYKTNNFDLLEFRSEISNKQINTEALPKIFKAFDNAKKRLKLYDYSDWLKMADNLLDIPEVRGFYQNRFKIIIADEIQDFTPLMFSIYSKLISNNTKTLGIGDPDQTIYRFMGASPDNINKYGEILGIDVEEHYLSVNRRCAKKTFHFANNLRNEVEGRKAHPIETFRNGGRFVCLHYETFKEEVELIIDELQRIPYKSNAILFREQSSSLLLSRLLYLMKIKVGYINALPFTKHYLYSSFKDILYHVFLTRTRNTWKDLYKILPFSKEVLKNFFNLDGDNQPLNFPEIQDWIYIDFYPLYKESKSNESIGHQIIFLQGIAENINKLSTSDYINLLLELFYKNYFQFIVDTEDLFLVDVVNWIIEDFSSYNNLRKVKSVLDDSDNLLYYGSTGQYIISTIHGSKGLEFDRVILAHIEQPSTKFRIMTKEEVKYHYISDINLYYVAATRQRDCLVLLFNKNKKHLFDSEKFLMPEQNLIVEEYFPEPNLKNISSMINKDNNLSISIKRKFKL